MLRVNKKMEYGILALAFLAAQPGRTASVREISAACRIPEALLSKVMQAMKNAGFVTVTHGNQGGYRLFRPLEEINLLNVTEILVGPVQVAECLEPGNDNCPVGAACTLMAPMHQLNQKIMQLFAATTVHSLVESNTARADALVPETANRRMTE